MRVRASVGIIVLLVVGVGCSSSANKATPARAVGIGLAAAGAGPLAPMGVTAPGSATQKVPADLAFVVVGQGDGGLSAFGSSSSFSSGSITVNGSTPPSFTATTLAVAPVEKDHDAIRAALRPLGIASDAIEFSRPDSLGSTNGIGNGSVQIEVPVAKLPQIATAVVAAVKKTWTNVAGDGLLFAVRDCSAAITTARGMAIADARKHAEGLATAAGVTLGELSSVSEQPAQQSPFPYFANGGQAPCGRGAVENISVSGLGASFAALDAKPQVELRESVSASYALAATDPRGISAVGNGEASGPADAADIVILPQGFPDPSASSAKIDEARVLRSLAPLGIETKSVEVENPTSFSSLSSQSSSYVRVHVTVAQVKSIGTKIVDAVQSVVGTDGSSGVVFSASNCAELLARARVAAVTDAGKRIDKLATAAHVHAGAVVGVAEADATAYLPFIAPLDPCKPDLSSLSSIGLLAGLAAGNGSGLPTLAGIDAAPKVTERVSLSIDRAMTS